MKPPQTYWHVWNFKMIHFSSFFWSSQALFVIWLGANVGKGYWINCVDSLIFVVTYFKGDEHRFCQSIFKQEKLIVFVWVNFIIEIYIKAVGKLFFIHELLLKTFEVSAVSTPPIDLSVDWPNVFLCRPIVRQLLKCLRYQRLRR